MSTPALVQLMNEHRLIEDVLSSLQSCVRSAEAGEPLSRATLRDYAMFFKTFADQLHHGKEEELLFQRMIEGGFSRGEGPLFVMLHEHDVGRSCVRTLADLGTGRGPLSPEDNQRALEAANTFISMLRAHIQKEDNVLYPMAEKLLRPDVHERLDNECRSFDQAQAALFKESVDRAASLLSKYPPDLTVGAGEQDGCAGCQNRFCEQESCD